MALEGASLEEWKIKLATTDPEAVIRISTENIYFSPGTGNAPQDLASGWDNRKLQLDFSHKIEGNKIEGNKPKGLKLEIRKGSIVGVKDWVRHYWSKRLRSICLFSG
ncbi:hypothetical protein BGZ96_009361 [Linnemannia gamsii]|uniref:CYTH domain-containing protein n=1 Tax=Linnemannia gamsii TaxID=64522 RepID=A0ABQ7JX93_9FUNG|nr:hypothetical protein BGZ96_009361 [Linnemannia gamsii]